MRNSLTKHCYIGLDGLFFLPKILFKFYLLASYSLIFMLAISLNHVPSFIDLYNNIIDHYQISYRPCA